MGFFTKGNCDENIPLTKLLVCLILGVIFLLIVLLIEVLDPSLMILKYNLRVEYGSVIHEALSKEADGVHISVYLFNITNIEQFLSGEDEKLKVQEIGPLTYQENRTNEDLVIDTEAGLMWYNPKHRVTFLPEESIGDPTDLIVTMPNIAMMAMGSSAKKFGFLGTMGFNILTTRHSTPPVVIMSAHKYLWGYDEPLIKLGNQYLPGWINFDKLGLFDRLYDERSTIRVGVSTREDDKFVIKNVNGLSGIAVRGYENPDMRSSCNSFNDAFEGLAYPVRMSPSRPIKIYRNVLCQFLELDYQGTVATYYGVNALTYKISNKTFTIAPENQCLCNDKCYDGLTDLSPCFYGFPMALSNAHFLHANPSIYDKIEGISPDEEKHGSFFAIDSIMGMALATKFSIQLNVVIGDVKFNSKLSKFSDMIVPVMVLEIVQPKLPEDQIWNQRFVHIYSPYINLGIKLVLILIGLMLLSFASKILYWNYFNSRRKGIRFQLETKDSDAPSKPLMTRIIK